MKTRILDKTLIDFHLSKDYILVTLKGDSGKKRQMVWMKNPPTYIRALGAIEYIVLYENPETLIHHIIELSKTTRIISWYKDILISFLGEELIEETGMLFAEDLCIGKYKNTVCYSWDLGKDGLSLMKDTFRLPVVDRFEDDDKFFLLHGSANIDNLSTLVTHSMVNFSLWEETTIP